MSRLNPEPSTATALIRVLLLLAMLLAAFACSGDPAANSTVGRAHLALEDAERSHWSGDGSRPLQTTVWYPAPPEVAGEEWRGGVFRFGHSALNAPFLDTARRPLIIVSHGTGGSAAQMSWLAEQLVGAGFIVAGVNHHGNTVTEVRQWPGGFIQPWERTRDVSVLIDQLLEHPDIGPRIDPERLGAVGFSLGGYSVLGLAGVHLPSYEVWQQRCGERADSHACQLPPEADFSFDDVQSMQASDPAFQAGLKRGEGRFHDERIGAVYAIAPALVALLEENDSTPGAQAIRMLLAENDEQIELEATTAAVERAIRPVSSQASLWVMEGASHYTYLAPCTLRGRLLVRSLCGDPWGRNRQAAHAAVGADVIDYFSHALSHNESQGAPLDH
ncbi:alpha/beta hydrolase family protein [Natronospira sp.]|uniref:alpha/beta hydrolase family protein n=1 Tax=Natronospira sp. TaxID=2024970 RepID=UPI003872A9D9